MSIHAGNHISSSRVTATQGVDSLTFGPLRKRVAKLVTALSLGIGVGACVPTGDVPTPGISAASSVPSSASSVSTEGEGEFLDKGAYEINIVPSVHLEDKYTQRITELLGQIESKLSKKHHVPLSTGADGSTNYTLKGFTFREPVNMQGIPVTGFDIRVSCKDDVITQISVNLQSSEERKIGDQGKILDRGGVYMLVTRTNEKYDKVTGAFVTSDGYISNTVRQYGSGVNMFSSKSQMYFLERVAQAL